MSPAHNWLQSQWSKLAEALAIEATLADRVFVELVNRYSANGRAYHNLSHIQRMLQLAAEYQQLATDWAAVQLAIWYHDAVYEPGAADNEALSGQLARTHCQFFNLPEKRIAKIEKIILATNLKEVGNLTGDTCLVLDADLAILGSEPDEYNQYAQAIRQEFAFVSEADFRRGRAAVLNSFLQRPRIYRLDEFYRRFEPLARENMSRELANLEL